MKNLNKIIQNRIKNLSETITLLKLANKDTSGLEGNKALLESVLQEGLEGNTNTVENK